ncbi:hypothetical protein OYC64_013264 [Pagothenia borchgrevinki]|uniref:Uncharacterized protein n=1 Tax=Pagothenia borchgrevinki TaxID=8213 RepID=A0ABD2FT75_PAGBO
MSSDSLKDTLLKRSSSYLRWFCRRLRWWLSSSSPNLIDATTTNISEITDFMVSNYTKNGALSKAAHIWRMMGCEDEADRLEPEGYRIFNR